MLYRNIQVFIDHNMSHPVIVAPIHIAELRAVSYTDKGVKFGASATLTRIQNSKMLYRNTQVFIDHNMSHPVIVAQAHIAELRAVSRCQVWCFSYSKCSKITNTKKYLFSPLFVILEITFAKKC